MVVETRYPYVVMDEGGELRVEGTGMKLSILMAVQQAQGYSPEELLEHYPALTLAKIYAALAFYHNHKAVMDARIAADEAEAEALRPRFEAQTEALRAKLRTRKAQTDAP